MQDFSWLAQGVQPVQLPDPAQQMARAMSLQELARRGREGDSAEKAHELDRQSNVLAAQGFAKAQQSGDWKSAIIEVAQQGEVGALAAQKMLKVRKEDETTQADLDLKRSQTGENVEKGKKSASDRRIAAMGEIGSVAEQEARNPNNLSLSRVTSAAKFHGVDLPPMTDGDVQGYLSQLSAQAYTIKDRLANETTQRGQDITVRGQDVGAETSRRGQDIGAATAKAGQQVTMRGQNMEQGRADARLEFDKGKGADKPLTEVQGNATAYGMRMKASNDVIDGLETKGFNIGSVPNKLLPANAVGNYLASPAAQQAYQAKLNFMTASLRKESGAAISASEFETEDKKYFPQPGDKPPAIEQKRQMRALAIQAMSVQAGPGAKNIGKGGGSAVLKPEADGSYTYTPGG